MKDHRNLVELDQNFLNVKKVKKFFIKDHRIFLSNSVALDKNLLKVEQTWASEASASRREQLSEQNIRQQRTLWRRV